MAVQRSQTRLSLRAFCLACSHLPRVWRSRAGGSSHRFPGAVGPRRPTERPPPEQTGERRGQSTGGMAGDDDNHCAVGMAHVCLGTIT